ncbi:MAG: AbrB/MazE/SpoVT family DNA-binding domain-containing protein [Chloroflexi bacterium]|nr:AbrB/MazE/SpoVT family DNA-binding domain-containing protein [Chloroflexota bacterium]
MLVKITSKRQVTFPKHVLDELGVGPGDRLELREGPDGYILKPRRIDYSKLGTLRDKIKPGTPPFDIRKFRDERERGHGPAPES